MKNKIHIFYILIFCVTKISAQIPIQKGPLATNKILRLVAANGTNTDETIVYFNTNAGNGYDGFDSPKMFALVAGLPQLYTTIGTDTLVINGYNNVSAIPTLPLGFRTYTPTNYTITATEISNFDPSQQILLQDKETNTIQDLRSNPVYSFYSAATNSTGRFVIIFSNTWMGATSADWTEGSNWSSLSTPSSSDNVYIPAGMPYLPHVTNNSATPAVCKNLIIQSGAVLTIDEGKALTATGKLSNYGSFIIKSDMSSIGSFIDNGQIEGTGSFIVEKFISGSGGATPSGRYWYQSSPLSNAKSIVFDAAGPNKLWLYNEPSHAYTEILDNTTSLLQTKGYVLRTGADATYSYTGGVFNTGVISNANLTRTGTTDSKRGFSLIGNPYPSHIDWNTISKTNLDNTIWFRTQNTSNAMVFDTYNSSGIGTNNNGHGAVTNYIAPTQAFWVHVDADGNTGQISFDNSVRLHYSTNTLKTEKVLNSILRLVVADGANTDEAVIYFNQNASNSFDAYDSHKIFSLMAGLPQIYTTVGTDTLVINGLQDIITNSEVPIGFRTLSSSSFTITATEISNFDLSQTIYLQDNLLGVTQNLRTNPTYSFTSGIVNTASRFKLLFDLTTPSIDIANEPSLNIYNVSNFISIVCKGYSDPSGTVSVMNILGQEVYSEKINKNFTNISPILPKGIYIVKAQTSFQEITKKIVID